MNCHDIAHILDHADIRRASTLQNASLSAHLAACEECARDWELQMRLQALPDPGSSPGLAGRMRAAVGRSEPGRPVRHVANGYVIGTVVIAVAAAAAMLVARWDRSAAVPADSAARVPPAGKMDVVPVPNVPSASPRIAHTVAGQRASAASTSTLRIGVLPLVNHASDAAAQAAIEGFYEAILDNLREDPDVELSRIDSREAAAGKLDLLLEVSGSAAGNRLRGMLRATRLGADPLTLPVAGEFDPSCREPAVHTQQCFDGAALVASMLGAVRRLLVQSGTGPRQLLMARVGDSAATTEQRMTALRELSFPRLSAGEPSVTRLQRTPPAELANPLLLQGAIDLAAIATPAQRAEVWRILRGVRDSVLADPLVQSARLDVDAAVRAEAVASLGAGFADDPRIRNELGIVARQDAMPMVRALARRALSEEQTWRRYVMSALKDDGLPAADRLEPLLHHLNEGSGGLGELFDDAAIRGFATALAQAGGTPLAGRVRTLVFSRAQEVESAAMSDLLLENFRQDTGVNRMMLLNQLIRRPRDVRIEALLQQVAATDADRRLREIAAAALAGQRAHPATAH